MNTELLKTFLEVERTRHFGKAAHNLFLTQTAVSARIRLLEQTLGVALFSRARNNIQLTRQGERLLIHAREMLRNWDKALAELAVPEEMPPRLLRVGGSPTVWEAVVQDWLYALYRRLPGIVVQADAQPREILLRKLADGLLDVVFLAEPARFLGLESRVVSYITLRMMASQPDQTSTNLTVPYVHVDWGPDFQLFHQRAFPTLVESMQCNQGRIALTFIEACGGAAYLAAALYLQRETLYPAREAPEFRQQIVCLFSPQSERLELIEETMAFFSEPPLMPGESLMNR